jgi:hypothetical protein
MALRDERFEHLARHRVQIAQIDQRFIQGVARRQKVPAVDTVPPHVIANCLSL